MSNNIVGKVVVITGASSGLGQAAARLLSAQGASIALGARRVDRLKSLADELTAAGGKALAVATDVTNFGQMKHLVDAAVQTFGRIDVIINTSLSKTLAQGGEDERRFTTNNEQLNHPYSHRRAITGSTRVARSAGM